jgi:hypothetical protein
MADWLLEKGFYVPSDSFAPSEFVQLDLEVVELSVVIQ